jgi:hypothetical protein
MVNVTVMLTDVDDTRLWRSERVGAEFIVDRGTLQLIDGEHRWVQQELLVPSPRHERLIGFADDPEEWARNLPRAYRNGAIWVTVREIGE